MAPPGSAAIAIVRPPPDHPGLSPVAQAAKAPSPAPSSSSTSSPAKADNRLCRNLQLFGTCKYADRGCQFSHDLAGAASSHSKPASPAPPSCVASPSLLPSLLLLSPPPPRSLPDPVLLQQLVVDAVLGCRPHRRRLCPRRRTQLGRERCRARSVLGHPHARRHRHGRSGRRVCSSTSSDVRPLSPSRASSSRLRSRLIPSSSPRIRTRSPALSEDAAFFAPPGHEDAEAGPSTGYNQAMADVGHQNADGLAEYYHQAMDLVRPLPPSLPLLLPDDSTDSLPLPCRTGPSTAPPRPSRRP